MAHGESRPKLACLDGLRGIAVIAVILFHIGTGDPTLFLPAVSTYLSPFRFGFSGVHLFLVLSGFCLTLSRLRRERAGRPSTFPEYLSARWRRIAPPYYAAIVLYLALPLLALIIGREGTGAQFLTIRQLAAHVTFLHGLLPDTIYAINTPFWSLSLEFQFYLALPLLCLAAARVGPVPVIAVVALTSVAWRAILASWWPDQAHLVNGFILGRLTEFVLGIGVAFWYEAADRKPIGRLSSIGLTAFVVVFMSLGMIAVDRGLVHLVDFAFGLGFSAILVVVLNAAEHGGLVRRFVENRLLVWAGVISYSLYLTNSLFLGRLAQIYRRLVVLPSVASDLGLITLMLGAVILGGWIFHVLIERRFLGAPAPRTKRPADAVKLPPMTANLLEAGTMANTTPPA
jgi:peptidoglycan/LPS O-acetylase OafA/YrhL